MRRWLNDRQVPAGLPPVRHMEGEEKRSASQREVSGNYAAAWAERVLGLLDDLALVQKGTHFWLAPMSERAS